MLARYCAMVKFLLMRNSYSTCYLTVFNSLDDLCHIVLVVEEFCGLGMHGLRSMCNVFTACNFNARVHSRDIERIPL